MGTTPLWVPLVVAAIAVIGTLAGVTSTQIWNSRNEARRWARENDRLREVHAREDRNLTYEHRRAAYVEFQQELDRLMDVLQSNKVPILYGDRVYAELNHRWGPIRVYGTFEADSLAFESMDILQQWGMHPEREDLADDAFDASHRFLSQIRQDLGVPEAKSADALESKQAIDRARRHRGRSG